MEELLDWCLRLCYPRRRFIDTAMKAPFMFADPGRGVGSGLKNIASSMIHANLFKYGNIGYLEDV